MSVVDSVAQRLFASVKNGRLILQVAASCSNLEGAAGVDIKGLPDPIAPSTSGRDIMLLDATPDILKSIACTS